MTTDIHDQAAVEKKLWDEIADTHFGMIAPAGGRGEHFQPMTAFTEPEAGKLWFYTRTDSDIAIDADAGCAGLFVFMSKDRQLQASIRGQLRTTLDALHRDKYWNPVVAAWYPKGKNDAHLTMLCLDCTDAQVWISEGGPVKFGWEVAKANLTGSEPDIGGTARLRLG